MKKALAALAALVMAAGAYVGLSDTLHPPQPPSPFEDPPAVVQMIAPAPVSSEEDAEEAGEDEDSRRSWKARLRAAWAGGGRLLWQLLVVGPLSLIGHAFASVLAAVGGVVLAALRFVLLEVLGTFLALLLPLCLLYKALFPDKKLRDFLTRKNLLHIFITSLFVSAISRLVQVAWPEARGLCTAAKALLLLLAMVWLWHRTFHLQGRFTARLRRLFWSRWGLALFALTAAGCILTIWVQTGFLRGAPVRSELFGGAMRYLLCAAVAFVIFLRQRGLRRRRERQKQAAV